VTIEKVDWSELSAQQLVDVIEESVYFRSVHAIEALRELGNRAETFEVISRTTREGSDSRLERRVA
jgi:hypothetical protein